MPNFSVPPPPLVSSSPAFPVLSVLGSVGTIQTPSPQLTHIQSSQNWPTHTSAFATLDKSHVLNSTNKLDESAALPVPEEEFTKTSSEAPLANEDNEDQVDSFTTTTFWCV